MPLARVAVIVCLTAFLYRTVNSIPVSKHLGRDAARPARGVDGFRENRQVMPPAKKAESTGPGRPPREGLDRAILDATLAEMARVGYPRMSVEAVARHAGTTKTTIYTRFPSKAALATGALESLRQDIPRHLSGEVRHDLIEELTAFRKGALRPNGLAMLGAVLAEQQENPELLRLFRKHVVQPRRENLRRILRAAQQSDQIDRDADIEVAITMLVGSLQAASIAGRPPGKDWPERVVDAWLRQNVHPRHRADQQR
jgi:AcrR family transcriptional regulator